MLCPHCADGSDREQAHRVYVLQLLALIEHPSALPAEAALRIGHELLAWAGQDASNVQCGHIVSPEVEILTAV